MTSGSPDALDLAALRRVREPGALQFPGGDSWQIIRLVDEVERLRVRLRAEPTEAEIEAGEKAVEQAHLGYDWNEHGPLDRFIAKSVLVAARSVRAGEHEEEKS